jgi:hypothetical protein
MLVTCVMNVREAILHTVQRSLFCCYRICRVRLSPGSALVIIRGLADVHVLVDVSLLRSPTLFGQGILPNAGLCRLTAGLCSHRL